MIINKKSIKQLFEENGYYISNYILAKAYIALKYLVEEETVGQKVNSTCLDGPSGAGKTHFVDVYCKVASKLLGKRVKFINFQLDAETGKSELYEDIDVVATFENDPSKIRLPGKIVEAIKAVNNGEYVILKMDEYDKARDATDTFFNNFLQEALINTTQHGDVFVNKNSGGKLQVFLCKNDQRAELSEPMMRRNRMIRLDYMTPERMHQILSTFAEKYNCPSEIVNMVTLFYEEMFLNKEKYRKLPSCSECQQAIIDAKLLLQDSEFTQSDIYVNIIENLLKMEDDIKTFESLLASGRNQKTEQLNQLVTKMKNSETEEQNFDLNEVMLQTVFKNEGAKLTSKIAEIQGLIEEYRQKFAEMEAKRQASIDEEIAKISLNNGTLVSAKTNPNVSTNFEDESSRIKRGHNIFELSDDNWTDIATLHITELSHHILIDKMIEHINELGITIYENGTLLKEDGSLKLIVVKDIDEDNLPRYRIMASHPVIPSTYLNDITNFFSFATQVYEEQPKTAAQITSAASNTSIPINYDINALVYNDEDSFALDYESVDENIYYIEKSGISRLDTDYSDLTSKASCQNPENAIAASNKIMSGNQKVLTNE